MDFYEAVYRIVADIPSGKIMTYGQIALLAGHPRAARAVGHAMRKAPYGLPCHRVVHQDGSMCPGYAFGGSGGQQHLLEKEGILFEEGRIRNLEHYRAEGKPCRY